MWCLQIGHTQEDILQKLIMNGEFLQNSSSALLTELGIVDKLTYKFRNAHGKQKFYKYLEKVCESLMHLAEERLLKPDFIPGIFCT